MDVTVLPEIAVQVAPATGDAAVIIGVVAGVSVAAMVVLTVLSKKGKGRRR